MTDFRLRPGDLPEPRHSPVRVLFCGRNRAASWEIRGAQVAATRHEWVAQQDLDAVELDRFDVACVVKRPHPLDVERLRARGLLVVYDVLDSWAQPDDGLRCTTRAAARDLFATRWRPFRFDAFVFANRCMQADLGALVPVSSTIYHHHWPGLRPAPLRERARTVGYVGAPHYLGPWRAVLEEQCAALGLSFLVNPPRFADIDIGVAVRGGVHDSLLANRYKSNVKLANFYAAGIPCLAGAKEHAAHEVDTGDVRFFVDPEQLRRGLEALLDPTERARVRARFLAASEHGTLARVAERYESFFLSLLRRSPRRRPLPAKRFSVIFPRGLSARFRSLPVRLRRLRALLAENALLRAQRDADRVRLKELWQRAQRAERQLAALRAGEAQATIDEFHRLFYASSGWRKGRWQGVPLLKNPLDLFLYQELLWRLRPLRVVELGAHRGGSALYFAHLFDLLGGEGRVISVSIDDAWDERVRGHPRITTIAGDSVDPEVVAEVHRRVPAGSPCLVVLDSDHSRDHVLAELRAYADLPAPGHYLVVEDGNINGHPVRPDHGPGPWEAVDDFLAEDERFVLDRDLERRFLFSFACHGFLRRRASEQESPEQDAAAKRGGTEDSARSG
ncbi:MAG: hypothetical protein D6731_02295 [Planctomycetota bacterium]|nr:MAG: hypothetical protein D6731_02295 [Planctomycetota bacterium]